MSRSLTYLRSPRKVSRIGTWIVTIVYEFEMTAQVVGEMKYKMTVELENRLTNNMGRSWRLLLEMLRLGALCMSWMRAYVSKGAKRQQ